MNIHNKKNELHEKLCIIFNNNLSGDELMMDLIGAKWYEIEMSSAIDFFFDDIDCLAQMELINIDSNQEATVKYYLEVLHECKAKGFYNEVNILNLSTKKIKNRLSLLRRVLPLAVFIGVFGIFVSFFILSVMFK